MAFGAGLTSSKSYLYFSTLHFLAFVFAVTVCGLYGVELDRARKADKYADSKWVCHTFMFSQQNRLSC